jgi:hypothetical protein
LIPLPLQSITLPLQGVALLLEITNLLFDAITLLSVATVASAPSPRPASHGPSTAVWPERSANHPSFPRYGK